VAGHLASHDFNREAPEFRSLSAGINPQFLTTKVFYRVLLELGVESSRGGGIDPHSGKWPSPHTTGSFRDEDRPKMTSMSANYGKIGV
jgi:hypothetical protein